MAFSSFYETQQKKGMVLSCSSPSCRLNLYIYLFIFRAKGILVPLPWSLALCCLPPQSASLTGLTNKNQSTNALYLNIKNITKTKKYGYKYGDTFFVRCKVCIFYGWEHNLMRDKPVFHQGRYYKRKVSLVRGETPRLPFSPRQRVT